MSAGRIGSAGRMDAARPCRHRSSRSPADRSRRGTSSLECSGGQDRAGMSSESALPVTSSAQRQPPGGGAHATLLEEGHLLGVAELRVGLVLDTAGLLPPIVVEQAAQRAGRRAGGCGLRVRVRISSAFWVARRPSGKARGERISGICKRRATQPGGMDRRPDAGVIFARTLRWGSGARSGSRMEHDVGGACRGRSLPGVRETRLEVGGGLEVAESCAERLDPVEAGPRCRGGNIQPVPGAGATQDAVGVDAGQRGPQEALRVARRSRTSTVD